MFTRCCPNIIMSVLECSELSDNWKYARIFNFYRCILAFNERGTEARLEFGE